MMNQKYLLILFLTVLSITLCNAQNTGSPICGEAQPLCGSAEFSFPNTSNGTLAENGPDYGCLGSQPNPAWFYLQIAENGSLALLLEQSTTPGGAANLDVDFILYGPFTDVQDACMGDLTTANTVDCSFSPRSVETVNIANGIAGELYVLLITNFSGQPGHITVTQTSGSGATDCSIVSSSVGCEGESIVLDATTENAQTYVWYEEDVANPGDFLPIAGVDTETHAIFVEKKYRAEALDAMGTILETYDFNTTFFAVPIAPPLITDYQICDNLGGEDGIATFDLSTKVTEILNGQDDTVFDVLFFATEDDANANANALAADFTNTTAVNQTLYARIYNQTTTNNLACFIVVPFNVVVNSVPNVAGLNTSTLKLVRCELDGNDIEAFNLNEILPSLEDTLTANGQSVSDYNFTFYSDETDASNAINDIVNPANYENETVIGSGVAVNPQTIYVRIEDALPVNGLRCNTIINFEVEVQDQAVAVPPLLDYVICDNTLDNGVDNGFGLFNLGAPQNDGYDYNGDLYAEIVSPLPVGTVLSDFTFSFYSSDEGAQSGVGHPDEIALLYQNEQPFNQTIYVRVENATGDCYATTQLNLVVNSLPIFDLEESYTYCEPVNGTELINPPLIDTGLNAAQYQFEWYINGEEQAQFSNMSSINPTTPGEYSVVVTDAITGCNNTITLPETYTATVIISSPPELTTEVISPAFSSTNSIQVFAEGSADSVYEFSLNNGPWILGSVFGVAYVHTFSTDVMLGENTIAVRDVNGCGYTTTVVEVMDYPLFFTPNGDGINDTWNIASIDNQRDAKIYIYNRYGKLLKQINPTGSGWNGTYNGEQMPASDYWFTVEYREPNSIDVSKKTFKSHFTLKR